MTTNLDGYQLKITLDQDGDYDWELRAPDDRYVNGGNCYTLWGVKFEVRRALRRERRNVRKRKRRKPISLRWSKDGWVNNS